MKPPFKEIISIVGENYIFDQSSELEAYFVDGKKPKLVVFPNTVEEISEIIKVANRDSLAIIPWGGGTKISLGNLPERVDVILGTTRLNQVLEHYDSDLVATTECGITLKDFQTALKEKNQTLPIDPPHLHRGATVGGIIATNDSGPKRLRYGTIHGTLRELILAIKVIRPDGNISKGGAKVVKSVAGYDLPKLYVGSLGTIGIIAEATFRLYPIPECSQTYLVKFPNLKSAHDAVLSILDSPVTPTCLEIINDNLKKFINEKINLNLESNGVALATRIESVEKAVKSQVSKLQEICSKHSGDGILVENELEDGLWNEIREFSWTKAENEKTVCKASVLVTDIPKVFEKVKDLSKNSALEILASARAGNGVLIISLDGEISKLIEAIISLRDLVNSLRGTLIIQEAPVTLKSEMDVWGDMGSSLYIMKKLKSQFDPNCIMNPGRFIGGI